MKLQSISLIAAICLVATAAASPIPKEEKRVAKPHNGKQLSYSPFVISYYKSFKAMSKNYFCYLLDKRAPKH
ncbi:13027_t:CDS:2, partial [Gigaspora margarita]